MDTKETEIELLLKEYKYNKQIAKRIYKIRWKKKILQKLKLRTRLQK
jgi:hypothetical protein